MKVTSLQLNNFRNYEKQTVEFDDGLNVLYGKNASGKTNLLESVYLCSVLKSDRTTKDKELVRFGAERAQIKLVVEKIFRKHTILIQIDGGGKKKVAVDGIPVQRAGELLGILGVVFFSPDEMKLVKESPAERRRFLDVGLSQQQKSYFAALGRYNKILKQKNNLLKESRYAQNLDDMLDVWDVGLAEYGAVLIKKKTEYVERLNSFAASAHAKLSGGKEELVLTYECGVSPTGDVRKNLEKALENSRVKDKDLGYCSVGPHRDDIKIAINTLDARKFASQGQQRTVALSMKLAEAALYYAETSDKPVLLLDDVFSELDENRRKILLDEAEQYQTIITCTEFEEGVKAKRFSVDSGKIING